MPSPPSTSWQKPWVVAIVAASKLGDGPGQAVARRSTASAGPSASSGDDRVVAPAERAGQRLAPSPRSALTRRSRTRSRSSPVAIRVKVTSSSRSSGDALGDVAGGQRGDRVGLAGPGAGLEHGHAGGQRAADVELGRVVEASGAHRALSSSRSSRPSHSRRASRPKRVGSVVDPAVTRLVGRRGVLQQLGEGAHAAEHELVLGLAVLAVEVALGLSTRCSAAATRVLARPRAASA